MIHHLAAVAWLPQVLLPVCISSRSGLEIRSSGLSWSKSLASILTELLLLFFQQQLAPGPNHGLRCRFASVSPLLEEDGEHIKDSAQLLSSRINGVHTKLPVQF